MKAEEIEFLKMNDDKSLRKKKRSWRIEVIEKMTADS